MTARDEKGTEAQLTAQLLEFAATSAEAEALLTSFAEALFPSGIPPLERMTWSDDVERVNEGADAEAKLRAAEARYQMLVEQIPAVTFMAVLGEGQNEVYVSPHIKQMLGYSQAEWLADPFLWYNRLHPDDRVLWNEEFSRGCRSGGPFRAECRFLARDGHVVWVHGEARVLKDHLGRPHFLQGIAFDITESKQAQEVLLSQAVNTARTERELDIARRVQLSILPAEFRVDGLEISAAMHPASEVGGDYYDVLPFEGGAWIGIGDVSGHGLDAGLVMLMLQSSMSSVTRARPAASPREVLTEVNAVLYDNIRRRLRHDDHVTLSLLRYTRDGQFVVAGAHEDILIFRAYTGEVETFRPQGTWLGARANIAAVTTNTTIFLEEGDIIVLYTDGVTEAMNAAGQMWDIDRLGAALRESAAEGPRAVRDHVLRCVRDWMQVQTDDISLVVMRYQGGEGEFS